jgi:DNA-binding transcriptional LysR family regulator
MNHLESEVGVALFQRSIHGISLTQEGKIFYEGAKKLLAEEKKLLDACRTCSGQSKMIRLSNVEHQRLLMPVTQEFIRRYPDIEVEYVIHPNHSGEYRVLHGIMDIAETFNDPDEDCLKKLLSHGATYTPLAKFPFVAVMTAEHPLSSNKKLEPEELVPYETYYFEAITRHILAERLLKCFTSVPDHLHCLSNIDEQISLTYSILQKNEILITCNPYVYYVKEAQIVPLHISETQEYGILMSTNPSSASLLYRDLAIEMFRDQNKRQKKALQNV